MIIERYDKNRHDTAAVLSLLAMASGPKKPGVLKSLLEYFYSVSSHPLFVALDKDKVAGIIGIDYRATPYWWILHIAVAPELRMKGLGRSLIDQTAQDLKLGSVALETDRDAVGFYRACGFTVVEIVSNWPGVQRFRCTRGNWPKSMLEYYNNLT